MQAVLNIGVDVAKAELVIAGYPPGTLREETVRNDGRSISSWLRSVPPGSRIAVESTAGYQQPLVRLGLEAGMQVYVLHPKDVRRWAQGSGARGKTDRIDARMIADFIAKRHDTLHPYRMPSPAQQLIDELIRRRGKVIEQRKALVQTLATMPTLSEALQSVLRSLDALVAQIDDQISQQVQADAGMKRSYERLTQIPGFGPLMSATLASLFARMQFTSSDSVVAFSGLDPRPDDSGRHRGRRRITKRGPAELRRLLFVVALSASRTRLWKPLYEEIKGRGLHGTEAAIVLARKMLRAAFAVWRTDVAFDAAKLGFVQRATLTTTT